MNAAAAVWDAFTGFLKAANAILSFIPALVWAVVLACVIVHGWWLSAELSSAVKAKNEAVAARQQLEVKVKLQNEEAAKLLKALTAQVSALQGQVNEAHHAQEIQDANNQAVVDAQARRLRALSAASAGGQLRDPNAAGCRGPAPEGPPAPAAGGGANDAASPGGLLSVPLSRLLIELTGKADAIGRAYESCRADAIAVRRACDPDSLPPGSDQPVAPATP